MITLYGFGNIFEGGRGETKDLRVQWALEETGLPYRFEALDQTKGDLETDAYRRISPFGQAPVIDDDGFVVSESAAIVLYLAEKAKKLVPSDVQGRTRVVQWCFAAAATVESMTQGQDLVDIFGGDENLKTQVGKLVDRWIGEVDRRLDGRTWIACDDFTAADIVMAGVLRTIRKRDVMNGFPRVKAYYERCFARPAWQRTLELSAKRLGMTVDDIR